MLHILSQRRVSNKTFNIFRKYRLTRYVTVNSIQIIRMHLHKLHHQLISKNVVEVHSVKKMNCLDDTVIVRWIEKHSFLD